MPNGVDLSLFGEPPARDEALATELGIELGAPTLGFIGSFYDYEGIDDLISAMPILRNLVPNAKLLLVGGGEMDDEWRAKAQQSSASDSILFTGRVPHSEVERYYSLVDVLVYPRKKSRLTDLVTPLKPLEAMAQRRIVAASDVGGHRELITDGSTGYLFPADDPQSCAHELTRILSSREDWAGVRERGVEHVYQRHDWSRNAQNYLDVYQALLARNFDSRDSATALDERSADAKIGV